jgi:DNA-directed RNA polymerase subunit RPC12/RpoP
MELIALTCRHCGAPLEVPDDAKYVTCMHCGTQLVVRHRGSAAYTEKIDALDQRTDRTEDQVDDLHRRTALAELDRGWEIERERYHATGLYSFRYGCSRPSGRR